MKKGQKKKIKKKRIVCNIDFELIQKTTGKREEKRKEEKRKEWVIYFKLYIIMNLKCL